MRTFRFLLPAYVLLAGFLWQCEASAQVAEKPKTVTPVPVRPVLKSPAPANATIRPASAPAETRVTATSECGDLDGDGSKSAACGGDDCDDSNPARYPGATEVGNSEDEDCDPQSIGGTDGDRDGFIDANVSNPGGATGDDCNDSQATINPNAQELPNRLDDDCDGLVDNLLGVWWTPR